MTHIGEIGENSAYTVCYIFQEDYLVLFKQSKSILCSFTSMYFRFQSSYEPAIRVWKRDVDSNDAAASLAALLEEAKPLVGIRTKSNIKWYEHYPLLVLYTDLDYSSKSEYTCTCMHVASSPGCLKGRRNMAWYTLSAYACVKHVRIP